MTATVGEIIDGRRCVPFGSLDRRKILGASEVAPVLGISRHDRTPFSIYMAKHRTDEQLIDKKAGVGPALWGNRLEATILDAYAEDILGTTALNVIPGVDLGTVLHREQPWMAASPDGIVVDGGGQWLYGVECKNVDLSQAHRWGDQGSIDVPDEYALQCHWSMWVTGLDRWDVAALIGGNRFRVYTLRRDDDLLDVIVPRTEAFWARVVAHEPPSPESADNEFLSKLLKQMRDELVEGDEMVDGLALALRDARQNRVNAEQAEALIEAQIKMAIGDRAGAAGAWGKILFKQNKPGRKVDWETVARAAGATADMIAAATKETAGARPFRVTFAEGAL